MSNITVLLVDPDPDSLIIYTLMLEHHGYSVLRAGGASEGYRVARDSQPAVVITEIHLPGDSDPLSRQLKADPATARTPVIAVTSLPVRPGRHAEALAACDGVLAKPCVPSRLLEEVRKWTGRLEPLVQSA
jgi:two-component system, cell cycle response regulator DivK